MKAKLLAALFIAFAAQAHAETTGEPAPSLDTGLYRQLDELRSQNAILVEALKNKELQGKIDDLNAQGVGPSKGVELKSTGEQGLPQVQMVSGSAGRLTALISLPDGGRVTARVGARVPHVGVVRSISANEVIVDGQNGTIVLPFAGDAPLAATGQPRQMPPMHPPLQPNGGR
jgi:type IV pilus biogenesis protein PilP